jgi:phage FluMu protein Com
MREASVMPAEFSRSSEVSKQQECSSSDCRCLCGSLMAKITARGVEIKCRRCKRLQVIPNRQIMGRWTVVRGSLRPP